MYYVTKENLMLDNFILYSCFHFWHLQYLSFELLIIEHKNERSKSSHLPLLTKKSFQVHRALKHAVNAGLLRHRSGRYKAVFTLNPAPIKQPVNENNEQKFVDGTTMFGKQQTSSKSQSNDKEENRLMLY